MNRKFAGMSRGYSMIELLVVVAIIGLVALVTVPAFAQMYRSGKMKTSTRNLTTDIRTARQQAVSKGTRWKVSFVPGTEGARAFSLWEERRDATTGVRTWTEVRARELEDIVYFSATNFADDPSTTVADGGSNDVIFLPNGTIANWPTVAGVPAAAATVTVKTDAEIPKPTLTLTFSPTGNVRAQ